MGPTAPVMTPPPPQQQMMNNTTIINNTPAPAAPSPVVVMEQNKTEKKQHVPPAPQNDESREACGRSAKTIFVISIIFIACMLGFYLVLADGSETTTTITTTTTTTTTKAAEDALLILNKVPEKNKVPILLTNGSFRELAEFRYADGTYGWWSCSTSINGRMLIFGGTYEYGPDSRRQILEVGECGLSKIGSLPFDFHMGTCNSFLAHDNTQHALLCFGSYWTRKDCHTFDGRVTAAAASSNSSHLYSSLGKLGNALVAVASCCGFDQSGNLAVELWEGGGWTRLADFPHADGDDIWGYSTVTVEETMFLIGGENHLNKVSMGRRSGSGISWSRGTNLLIPRKEHRSVVLGQSIFNVGGWNDDDKPLETESWEVAEDTKRYRHQPEFDKWYPELFVLDTKYCPEGRKVQYSSFDPTASKILAKQRRFDNARAAKKAKKNY